MRLYHPLLVLLLIAAAGCASFQVEAGFKQPAELTSTAASQPVAPTPAPKPQFGKLAFTRGGGGDGARGRLIVRGWPLFTVFAVLVAALLV